MSIISPLPFNLQNGVTADATQVMANFNEIVTDTNANAAIAGANSNITSLSGLTTPLSIVQGGSGSQTPAPFVFAGGYRNIARRNGGMEIWQRGAGGAASFAVGASGGNPYTADGWYLNNGANQASVVSQQAGLANGSQWCARVRRNNGQTGTVAMLFGFPLDTDELYAMRGQFVRVSFVAKAGANWSPAGGALGVHLDVGTGAPAKAVAGYTGGTAPAVASFNLTASATRYQVNSSVVVPLSTQQAEIYFVWTPVGTAGVDDSFSVDDVQLEVVPASSGYTASDFERSNFEEQLSLCRRHYQKTFTYGVAPAQNADVNNAFVWWGVAVALPASVVWRLPVSLRLATGGTMTLYNPQAANAQVRNLTDGADWTNSAATLTGTEAVNLAGTANGGMSAGDVVGVHVTADAGI